MSSFASLFAVAAIFLVVVQTPPDTRTPEEKAFIASINHGEVSKLEQMLASNPKLVDSRSRSGAPAIRVSVYVKQPSVTALLLSHHPKIDLWTACALGSVKDVKSSIKRHGSKIDARSTDGITPLCMAITYGHVNVARILVQAGASLTARSAQDGAGPMNAAVFGRHLECVKFLVQLGAPVDFAEPDGSTPLFEAVENGDMEIVKFLVEHGADVRRKASDGQTPYKVAIVTRQAKVAEYLKKKGA